MKTQPPREPPFPRSDRGFLGKEPGASVPEAEHHSAFARYRQLVEQLPAVIYVAEPGEHGAWTYVSPQIERMLGFPTEDWIADPSLWARQLHPEDRERVLAMEKRVIREAERGEQRREEPAIRAEYRMIARDGRIVWIGDESYLYYDGARGKGLFHGVLTDVTDRKRAEEALERSEDRYRSLFHGIPIGMYRTTPDGEILDANQALADILGYPDVEAMRNVRAEDLYVDVEDRRPDGQVRWIRDSARAIRDDAGQVLYEGMFEDITEQRQAEEALRESEARFRLIAENAKDVIYRFRVRPTPGCEYVSPSITSITGYTPEEIYADPDFWKKAAHPDDVEKVIELFGSGRAFTETYSTRWVTKDGRTIWCETQNSPIHDEDGELVAFVGITRDVSEQVAVREELQDGLERLRRSDKERRTLMSRLVGAQEEERHRIAGEIHDDSVQVMAAVALRLEVLDRKLGPHEVTRSVLPELRRDVQTAVQRLRGMIFDLRPLALDRDGLAAALRLHLERLGKDSLLDCRLEDRLLVEPPDNVRMALYRIAQEAVANARKHAEARRLTITLDSMGDSVILLVTDDGRGFAAEHADAPTPGHVGLSGMREQAAMVGGELTIRSAPGRGTKVEARVPVPDDPADD